MLNSNEIQAAFEIAEQLVKRTEIRGVDVHKHIESSIGKYGLKYNSERKFDEFENFVIESVNKKIIQKCERKKQRKKINTIFTKDIYSKHIEGFKTHLEAAKYLDIKTSELNQYINKKILDKKFVIVDSYMKLNIFEDIEIEYRKIKERYTKSKKIKKSNPKIKIINIFTKEEHEFLKQVEAAEFLDIDQSYLNRALKLGSKIKREWIIERVG